MLNVFRTTPVAPIFEDNPLVAIDVGSRHGFDDALLPAAWCVDAVGFEPEAEGHGALTADGRWRSAAHHPAALASQSGPATLYVPEVGDAASTIPHDLGWGERFGKPHFFEPKATIELDALSLDDAQDRFGFPSADFIKLDVEGGELGILNGARRSLSNAVCIKVEVAFVRLRKGQPLFWEVAEHLDANGFDPVDFIHPHYWRFGNRVPHPYRQRRVPAYARGQLVFGDMIFMRRSESAEGSQMIKLCLVAMCLGFFDHAEWLNRTLGMNIDTEAINQASAAYGAVAIRKATAAHVRDCIPRLRSLIGGLP